MRPANFRTLRGLTCVAVTCDEIAHWFTATDYANPDVEILASLASDAFDHPRPAAHGLELVYAKHGELYNSFKKYFGPSGPSDVLVAFGTSRDMNPSLSEAEIAREIEKDPVRNRAEYSQRMARRRFGLHRPRACRGLCSRLA